MGSLFEAAETAKRRAKWKKLLLVLVGLGVVALIAIQFVPVTGVGVNPAERYALNAPPEVEHILRKACMDCHSNETRWPWYAKLAPSSWLLIRDVKKGRSRFNMSEWGSTDEQERQTDRENAWDQIKEGNMPPWFYIPMHLDARLTAQEKETLHKWLIPEKKPDAEKKEPAADKKEPAPEKKDEPAEKKEPEKAAPVKK
jgi:Haem-binding domain